MVLSPILRTLGLAFLYAAVTALVVLGLAFILFSDPAEDAAFTEIQNHRIASRCFFAENTDALRLIMAELDIPESEWPVKVDTNGYDCSFIPEPPHVEP